MKKIKYLIFSIIMLLPITAYAAGTATINGPSSIDNGGSATIKVTVKNTAAWNISISGSGNTSGCSTKVADVTSDGNNATKTFSVTCKSNGIGSITFMATGDITSSDGVKSYVNLSKTVSVVKPREKETESRLSSLSVDGYSIDFDKDKNNYSINVEPSVTSIKIKASAMSGRASVLGTGVKELDVDGGVFEVICKAENGTQKKYIINVSIIDNNPINVKIDGANYTIVKSAKKLTPPINTTANTTIINEIEVPSFISSLAKITVVGIKDNEENIKYAIYDNGNYKLYNENKSSELLLYISNKALDGYKETNVTINENEYIAYDINDRFKIVYAMNLINGEYNYYKYDTKDNTFQYFDVKIEKEKSNTNVFLITTIVFGIATLSLIGYIICLIVNKKTTKETKRKI